MIRTLLLLCTLSASTIFSQPQVKPGERVIHNDPAQYRELSAVHAGAGKMGFTQLIGRNDLSSNFLYLHTGVINAKSGIGHHFHHSIEEMYVLLTGEAEFTINGRTSLLKAPVAIPCKMGDSHAIHNRSGSAVKWLNFAVSRTKSQGDAFDLADDRTAATLDKIPVFVSHQFKKDGLRDSNHPYAGGGALHRRAFGPEIFSTNWNSVDHLVIPAGKSAGPRMLEGIEEVYYVMKGSGTLTVNSTVKPIVTDDAFAVSMQETMSLSNTGQEDLELVVISISMNKNQQPLKTKAIVLQMDFVVNAENKDAFEKMYSSIYVPAMLVQPGYLESKILRLFPENISKEISAEPTTYNYQVQISFDTEENRRKWVASKEHQIAWPAASSLAKEFKWRGYDVMGDNNNRK